jgi:hypothetical protein
VAAGVAKKLGDKFPVIMYVKIIVDVFRNVQKHGFVAGLMVSPEGGKALWRFSESLPCGLELIWRMCYEILKTFIVVP